MAAINRSVTVSVTADDYAVANKLFVLDSWKAPGFLGGVAILATLYVLLLGASYAGDPLGVPRELIHGTMIGIVIVTGALSLLSYFVLAPYYAHSNYGKQKSLHYPVTMSWSEAGLKTTASNGEWTVPWGDYLKWAENSKVILLFQAPRLFQMLPKRLLDAEQVADLRQCAVSVRR